MTEDPKGGDQRRLTVIACDESGHEGDRIFGSSHRVFSHGAIQLDEEEAEEALSELRSRLRAQAPELKAKQLLLPSAEKHRQWLFEPGGPIFGRASAFVIDKEFYLTSKIVDLLIEEVTHEHGIELYERSGALLLAREFHRLGPRSFPSEDWNRMLAAFNSLFRTNQRRGAPKTTVDEFYEILADMRYRSRRRWMDSFFDVLMESKKHAVERTSDAYLANDKTPPLDPLFSALTGTLRYWYDRFGLPVQVVHDEQFILTNGLLEQMIDIMESDHELSKYAPPIGIDSVRLVNSATDARVQLADIVAGVFRKCTEQALAKGKPESLPGELMLPFIAGAILA